VTTDLAKIAVPNVADSKSLPDYTLHETKGNHHRESIGKEVSRRCWYSKTEHGILVTKGATSKVTTKYRADDSSRDYFLVNQ